MPFLKWIEGIGAGAKKSDSDWLSNTDPNDKFYGFENFGNTCYSNSVIQALFHCKPFRECAILYNYPYSTIKNVMLEDKVKVDELMASKNIVKDEPKSSSIKKLELDVPLESTINTTIEVTNNEDIWAGNNIKNISARLAIESEQEETLLDTLQKLFSTISNQKKPVGVIGPKQFVTKLKEKNEIFAGTMQQDAHEMFNYLINEIGETLVGQKKEVREKIHSLIPEATENEEKHKTGI
jgi:ubiquitin C-terminal hydrolase